MKSEKNLNPSEISESEIIEKVIQPSLVMAEQSIPFFEIAGPLSDLVLYGAPGARLDSLGLVSLVFLIEENVEKVLGLKIQFTTQDVLDQTLNPFASVANLSRFLKKRIQTSGSVNG